MLGIFTCWCISPSGESGLTELAVGCADDVALPNVGGGSSPFVAYSGGLGLVEVVPMALRSGSTGRSSSGGWYTGLLGEWECSGQRSKAKIASMWLLVSARCSPTLCSWIGLGWVGWEVVYSYPGTP